MKLAFVYPNDTVYYKSPITGSYRLSKMFENSVSICDDNCNYEQLRSDGYRIFCYGHNPLLYNNRNFCKEALTDIVNSRYEYISSVIGKKCISGFSYWKCHKQFYNSFFPTVTTYKNEIKPSKICIGYYNRRIRPDTLLSFCELANRTPLDVDIIVMGEKINLIRPYTFTMNEDVFFSKCTHYYYDMSIYHQDPWPHTLLQACQCGCSIIIPSLNKERYFKDGINDILNVCDVVPISYKNPWEKLKPCTFAPSGEDFMKLYQKIFDSDFTWLPNEKWNNFSELYNYVIGL